MNYLFSLLALLALVFAQTCTFPSIEYFDVTKSADASQATFFGWLNCKDVSVEPAGGFQYTFTAPAGLTFSYIGADGSHVAVESGDDLTKHGAICATTANTKLCSVSLRLWVRAPTEKYYAKHAQLTMKVPSIDGLIQKELTATFYSEGCATTANVADIYGFNQSGVINTAMAGVTDTDVAAALLAAVTANDMASNSLADIIENSTVRTAVFPTVDQAYTAVVSTVKADAGATDTLANRATAVTTDTEGKNLYFDEQVKCTEAAAGKCFAKDVGDTFATRGFSVALGAIRIPETLFAGINNAAEELVADCDNDNYNFCTPGSYAKVMNSIAGAITAETAIGDVNAVAKLLAAHDELIKFIQDTATANDDTPASTLESACAHYADIYLRDNMEDLHSGIDTRHRGLLAHTPATATALATLELKMKAVANTCAAASISLDRYEDAVQTYFSNLTETERAAHLAAPAPYGALVFDKAVEAKVVPTDTEGLTKLLASYAVDDHTKTLRTTEIVTVYKKINKMLGKNALETSKLFSGAADAAGKHLYQTIDAATFVSDDETVYRLAHAFGLYPCGLTLPATTADFIESGVASVCSCTTSGHAALFTVDDTNAITFECGAVPAGHYAYRPEGTTTGNFAMPCAAGTKQPTPGMYKCVPCKSDEVCETEGVATPAWKYNSGFDPSTKSGIINLVITIVVVAVALIAGGVVLWKIAKKHEQSCTQQL